MRSRENRPSFERGKKQDVYGRDTEHKEMSLVACCLLLGFVFVRDPLVRRLELP